MRAIYALLLLLPSLAWGQYYLGPSYNEDTRVCYRVFVQKGQVTDTVGWICGWENAVRVVRQAQTQQMLRDLIAANPNLQKAADALALVDAIDKQINTAGLLPMSQDGATIPPSTVLVDGGLSQWKLDGKIIRRDGQDSGGRGDLLLWYQQRIYTQAGQTWWFWDATMGWRQAARDPRP
jgi:hypothetical protein